MGADPNYEPEKDELADHAVTLSIMLAEQKAMTSALQQSKSIIIDFLKDDGREALVAFFKIKGGLLYSLFGVYKLLFLFIFAFCFACIHYLFFCSFVLFVAIFYFLKSWEHFLFKLTHLFVYFLSR